MKVKLLAICIILILVSCAMSPSLLIPQSLPSNSSQGMIVGTIAFENQKPIFNQYSFYYIGKQDKKRSVDRMIAIRPEQLVKMKFDPDFYDDTKAVYYFSITENVGEYKFSMLGLFENGGAVQGHGQVPMDINFKIEKCKIKYLGEIYFNYRENKLILNDLRERDIPKFKERYPNLKVE